MLEGSMPSHEDMSCLGSFGQTLWDREAKNSKDKGVQAQHEDKIEPVRLQDCHALIDNYKVHPSVLNNTQKELLRPTIREMRLTTGVCKEGFLSGGAHDKAHEKSDYFQTGGRVSEKRLQKWKVEEGALQPVLLSEEELRSPWEKDSSRNAMEIMQNLFGMLGYGEDEAGNLISKMKKQQSQSTEGVREEVTTTSEGQPGLLQSVSVSSSGSVPSAVEPINLFECLKDWEFLGRLGNSFVDMLRKKNASTQSEYGRLGAPPMDLIFVINRNIRGKEFSVNQWENSKTQYLNSLAKPTGGTDLHGTVCLQSLQQKPKSAPVKQNSTRYMRERCHASKSMGNGKCPIYESIKSKALQPQDRPVW